MSHHSSEEPPEIPDALRASMGKAFGEYPDGRVSADGAGALAFGVVEKDGRVFLRFTKPVAWVGMTGDQAMQLAQSLIEHGRRSGITAPAIIRIGEAR